MCSLVNRRLEADVHVQVSVPLRRRANTCLPGSPGYSAFIRSFFWQDLPYGSGCCTTVQCMSLLMETTRSPGCWSSSSSLSLALSSTSLLDVQNVSGQLGVS